MFSDRRGNRPKPLDKNPSEQLRENLYMGLLSGFFVLDLLKVGGCPRCVTYFRGVSGCVTKCDREERCAKLAKNSVTYFMDGPLQTNVQVILRRHKWIM